MKLTPIEGNTQWLDGGSMFGNAPKELWNRWLPSDEKNRIHLAARALLVETDAGKRVLFDTGIGAFFEPKLKERFGVAENSHLLLKNLNKINLSDADIDAVVLSHLHFDHAGGLLSAYEEGKEPKLLFPNATFFVGKEHWERALQPHLRERMSFIPTIQKHLADSGRLQLLDRPNDLPAGVPGTFRFSHGHTVGLIEATIESDEGPVAFVTDIVPGLPWMHAPITMGYDRFPELLVNEKLDIFKRTMERNGKLFLTHDPQVVYAKVSQDVHGKFLGEALVRD
jgi:glyoxylase-like metal-dependent hydrolase (beta-lactamase superfamily II)